MNVINFFVAMAPKDVDSVRILADENEIKSEVGEVVTRLESTMTEKSSPPMQIVWRNVIWFIFLHAGALYGLFLIPWLHPYTWIWSKYFEMLYLVVIV